MKTIRVQRLVAGTLTLTGAFYAVVAWAVPFLWFGYVVWFGWLAVALGGKRWQEKWFWLVSGGWNLALLLLLLFSRGFVHPQNFQQWYVLGHLALAAMTSLLLALIVPWDTWPENRRA